MSLSAPNMLVALAQEQRYRRRVFADDRRQNTLVIAVLSLALYATIRNDLLLLRGSTLLSPVLASKLCHLVLTAIGLVLLHDARGARQYDRASLLLNVALSATVGIAVASRVVTSEVVGPMFGAGTYLTALYFGQRGAIGQRAVAGILVTAAALAVLWGPHGTVTSVGRVTGTVGLLCLGAVGALSMRAFESQRRMRLAAERHERLARQELARRMRELAAQKDRAEAMSRARTAFLAAMSHEFRTPMNAIVGLSDLLLASPYGGNGQEHLRTIRDSARALLQLLNNILDFAKIDAGRFDLALDRFELPALVQSVFAMMGPAAAARSLKLTLVLPDPPAKLPGALTGDAARLRQVLVNLVANAIKFTEKGGVTLRVGVQPGSEPSDQDTRHATISFAVEDTGIGIPSEVLGRLFRPFEQADGAITRRYGGTGLGLAISQQIVQAMGGDIHVQSTPGQGAIFAFALRLPVAEEQSAHPEATQPLAMPAPQRPLSILVVDDVPVNVQVASIMLARLGHRVDSVSDGAQAIQAVLVKPYDVVLMDLHMPEMSGLDTSRQILARLGDRAPQIMAMTASVFEADRQACKQAGMHGFIGKPIDIAELREVLGQVAAARAIACVAGDSVPPAERSPGDHTIDADMDVPVAANPDTPVAAIMHELNQPFAACLLNAETAAALLDRPVPDVVAAREALEDLLADCERAAQALRRLGVFLRQDGQVTEGSSPRRTPS